MALLFFDNFGGYATADLNKVWIHAAGNGTPVVNASGGRNNGPYISLTGNTNATTLAIPSITATPTFVVGFAYYTPNTAFVNTAFLQIRDGGSGQASLTVNADGTLSVVRGTSTAVTSGTSTFSLLNTTWYYIEFKITIADSIGAGTCEVRVNGVTWITVATGQDLKNTANATATQVVFSTTSSSVYRLTDVYIDNGTTFLGDCTVSTLTVSGAGTTNTLTTGTFADVDDALVDSDSTYAESAVNGQLATFAMSNLPGTPTTIHAVSPRNCVRKTDGGTKQFGAVVRSGGTDYVQATANALDSFIYDAPILTVDPATGVAWVAAGVNAVEVGVKVLS